MRQYQSPVFTDAIKEGSANVLQCGNLQKQDVASSNMRFFLGYMDTSLHSRIELPLFLLRIKRFQHLCNANRAETQLQEQPMAAPGQM